MDPDCNSLLMHVKISWKEYLLGSIYGPNHDTELIFYENLKNSLKQFRCPIILGGDWNATLDCSPVGTNIDVVNVRNIPSLRRRIFTE